MPPLAQGRPRTTSRQWGKQPPQCQAHGGGDNRLRLKEGKSSLASSKDDLGDQSASVNCLHHTQIYAPTQPPPLSDTHTLVRSLACVLRRGSAQLTAIHYNDRDNQAVDPNDTGHDDWNDTLHDEVRPHHSHGGDTHTTFGSAVCCSDGYQGRGKGEGRTINHTTMNFHACGCVLGGTNSSGQRSCKVSFRSKLVSLRKMFHTILAKLGTDHVRKDWSRTPGIPVAGASAIGQ